VEERVLEQARMAWKQSDTCLFPRKARNAENMTDHLRGRICRGWRSLDVQGNTSWRISTARHQLRPSPWRSCANCQPVASDVQRSGGLLTRDGRPWTAHIDPL